MTIRAGAAHVDIEPRVGSEFEGALGRQLQGPLQRVGTQVSTVGKSLSRNLTLPLVAGVAVLGGAAMKIDDALDGIRIGTGKTGEALASLEGSFRNVAARVPNDVGEVSQAISELHQRTGATGPGLEGLATQVLTLARITGTDLGAAIETSTRLFGDWGISADDQGAALDRLFTISQNTGVGVDSLAQSITQFGGPLRQLGFSMDESAALVGKFQKEGVNTELVLGSMRQALGRMAKAGEEPIETFRRVTDEIKNAGTAGEANALALEMFGARAGPDMAAAIREGRFEIGGLLDTLGDSEGAISKAATDTDGFSESWGRFRNKLMLAIEPLATSLLQALEGVMPYLQPLLDGIARAIEWFTNLDPRIQAVALGAVAFAAALGPILTILGPIITAIGALVGALSLPVIAIAAVVAALVLAYLKWDEFRAVVDGVVAWLIAEVWPRIQEFAAYIVDEFADLVAWVQTHWASIQEAIGHVVAAIQTVIDVFVGYVTLLWQQWGDEILNIAQIIWDQIRNVVETAINLVRGIIETVVALINGDWGEAWEGIKGILSTAWEYIKETVGNALQIVGQVIEAALSSLRTIWDFAWEGIKAALGVAWDWIKSTIDTAIGDVVGLVQGIPGRIAGFASSAFDSVKEGARAAVDGVVGFFQELPGRITAFAGDVGSAAVAIGRAVIDKIGEGLSGAVGIAGDIAGAVARAVKNAINRLIDMVNGALEFTIKGAGPLPDIHINPPNIPHLAKGARDFAGGLAVVGEVGPELVRLPKGSDVFSNRELGDLVAGPVFNAPLMVVEGNVDEAGARVLLPALERLIVRNYVRTGQGTNA